MAGVLLWAEFTFALEQVRDYASSRRRTRVIHRGDVLPRLVVLPNWTRFDTAVYYQLTPKLRAQVNIENVFDEAYYLYAHNNTNITPGSPRAFRFALTSRF